MNKRTFVVAVAVVALIAPVVNGQVVGTKHDLSSTLVGNTDQVCVFCHTPHNANDPGDVNGQETFLAGNAPLWNQQLSADTSYGQYDSLTLNTTDIANVDMAAYNSTILCMSCHDGTIAPGSMYNDPNGTTGSSAVAITGGATLGGDLSNDHPVNFTYANSVAQGDTGLVAEAGIVSYLDTGAAGGRLQCSSCHDPHDAGPDANVDFMRVTLVDSALCTTCHVK